MKEMLRTLKWTSKISKMRLMMKTQSKPPRSKANKLKSLKPKKTPFSNNTIKKWTILTKK